MINTELYDIPSYVLEARLELARALLSKGF